MIDGKLSPLSIAETNKSTYLLFIKGKETSFFLFSLFIIKQAKLTNWKCVNKTRIPHRHNTIALT